MTPSAPHPHDLATINRRQSDGGFSSTRAVVAERGRRRPWAEQQELIDLKLQIVKQQGKLDALCSRLNRCETANEALRAEKAILDDQLVLDREIIDALRRENHLLRRHQGRRPTSADSDTSSTFPVSESGRDDLVGTDLVCRHIDTSQNSRSTLARTVGPSEDTEASEFISSAKAIAKLTRRRSSATVPQRHFPFAKGGNEADNKPLPSSTEGDEKEPSADEQTKGPFGSDIASSTSEGGSAGEETPAKQDPPAKQDSKGLRRDSSAGESESASQKAPVSPAKQHKGLRQDYSLGDALRSQYHMVVEPTSEKAVEAVDSLQKHDFAFVKRSDGSHSYAIVAGREGVEIRDGETEVCIIFVINSEGSTKAVRRKQWSQSVHLVKVDG